MLAGGDVNNESDGHDAKEDGNENDAYDSSEEDESSENFGAIPAGALCAGTSNIHAGNNNDFHVGPKLLYNAPVTVNQFLQVRGDDGEVLRHALKGPAATELDNIQVEWKPPPDKAQESSGAVPCLFRHKFHLVIGLAGVVTAVVLLAVFLSPQHPSGSNGKKPTFPPPDPPLDANWTLPGGHRMYRKKDWYGEAPKYERILQHPTPFVVISHTVTQPCYSYTECAQQMRNMQDVYMSQDFPDLGYSFVVGNDGNVYEARGWDVTNMHTGFVRRCNVGVSLIGNFVHDVPTVGQLNATRELLQLGVALGKLSPDYKLVPMNHTGDTLSPGKNLYSIIQGWPHFWVPSRDDPGICPYA